MSELLPTAELGDGDLRSVRDLMDASFDDFSDHDWDHSLGGLHALVRDGAGAPVAHGSLVLRRMLVGGRALRCGYVEAVAVEEGRRRRGLGGAVMDRLEALAPGYDLLLLCASATAVGFYRTRGWEPWRGPTSVLSPEGVVPTPEEDGAVLVFAATVDTTLPITCDWRDGDVW